MRKALFTVSTVIAACCAAVVLSPVPSHAAARHPMIHIVGCDAASTHYVKITSVDGKDTCYVKDGPYTEGANLTLEPQSVKTFQSVGYSGMFITSPSPDGYACLFDTRMPFAPDTTANISDKSNLSCALIIGTDPAASGATNSGSASAEPAASGPKS